MRRSHIMLLAALLALAAGAAAWLSHGGAFGTAAEPAYATVLPEPLPLPEFTLHDQGNEEFTREDLRGRTTLMFFGFTHCPDICPATLQQLSLARKQISQAGGPLPEILLISVDPERDTPARLEQYVGHFGEGVAAATGSLEALRQLASPLGVFFEKQPAGDDYTVSHSTAVLVIDDAAMLTALFSAPHKTEHFVHDVPLLMAQADPARLATR